MQKEKIFVSNEEAEKRLLTLIKNEIYCSTNCNEIVNSIQSYFRFYSLFEEKNYEQEKRKDLIYNEIPKI